MESASWSAASSTSGWPGADRCDTGSMGCERHRDHTWRLDLVKQIFFVLVLAFRKAEVEFRHHFVAPAEQAVAHPAFVPEVLGKSLGHPWVDDAQRGEVAPGDRLASAALDALDLFLQVAGED